MKEVARDREMLMRIEPVEVEAYLRGTGWRLSQSEPGRASFWFRTDERTGEEFEVVCLLDRSLRDFAERMSEMLEAISVLEQRSVDEVYRSIADAGFDVAELQIERDDASDGMIPLKAGVHAFQGALKMYAAAAAAEMERRPFYPNLLSGQAAKFVSESARLGQTKFGSYVITIATRLPKTNQQLLQFGSSLDDPFERRVMRRLVTALDVVRRAAIQDSEAAFSAGIEHGVSADLCEAIARMAEGGSFQELNFSVRWSWLKPVKDVPSSISFSPQLVRNLRAGGAHLRYRKPEENYQLVGKVVRLERFPNEQEGTVGILGFVGIGLEKVAVTLTKNDYDKATAAHFADESVVCIGDLKREGRNFVLTSARKFTVIRTES